MAQNCGENAFHRVQSFLGLDDGISSVGSQNAADPTDQVFLQLEVSVHPIMVSQ